MHEIRIVVRIVLLQILQVLLPLQIVLILLILKIPIGTVVGAIYLSCPSRLPKISKVNSVTAKESFFIELPSPRVKRTELKKRSKPHAASLRRA